MHDNVWLLLALLLGCAHATLDIADLIKGEPRRPEECALMHWTAGDFFFPCQSARREHELAGRYIKRHVITTRLQLWKDYVLAVFPRYKSGVPATVGVAKRDQGCSVEWRPFPCWAMQRLGDCNAIQSAVDIFVDMKDRAWILDSGITNTVISPIRRCPPKVVVASLKTQKVERVINLAPLVMPDSRLQYLALDHSKLGHTFVYVSDAARHSILVWDVFADRGWRVVLPPHVLGDMNKRDVLYLALTHDKLGDAVLYFTYLSSRRLYSIRSEFLRRGDTRGRIVELGLKPEPMIILGTDGGTQIFFRFEGHSDVLVWDTGSCFSPGNFRKVYDGQPCRLATHVVPDYKKHKMMVLESNFQDFITDTVGCGTSHTLTPLLSCFKTCKF